MTDVGWHRFMCWAGDMDDDCSGRRISVGHGENTGS